MASSSYGGIPLIDPSQMGKAATSNTAFDAVDSMLNGSLSINAATIGSNPYTIPYQAGDEPAVVKLALRFAICYVTGTIAGDFTIYMPAGPQRTFAVVNNTVGGYNVIVKVSGQTGVTIPATETFLCFLNGTDVVQISPALASGTAPWEVGNFIDGSPTVGQIVMRFIAGRTITFPADFSSNQMKAGTGATGSPVFTVNKNGSQVGTATFAPSGTSPTWASASHAPVVFSTGDVGTFIAPNPVDGTLADLEWLFVGAR